MGKRGGRATRSIAALALLLALLAACTSLLEPAAEPAPAAADTVAVDAFSVQPEDGLAPVLREIGRARERLDVVVYLLTHPDIVDALIAAHRRDVRVRVMVEEQPFGGGRGNRDALAALERARVPWQYGDPVFRFTHQKTLIADGERALVMTTNLTKSAFTRNRGYLALVTSAVEVREIQALFDADWDRRGHTPRSPALVVSDANSRERLLGMIERARRSLEIEAEVMSDREIRAALVAAHRRDVAVRVVMSKPEPDETSYDGLTELARAGVGVRTVESPYIHAKAVLADGRRAYIGSVNFTATSMDQNRELGIITTTPAVLRALGQTFEADWAKGRPFRPGR